MQQEIFSALKKSIFLPICPMKHLTLWQQKQNQPNFQSRQLLSRKVMKPARFISFSPAKCVFLAVMKKVRKLRYLSRKPVLILVNWHYSVMKPDLLLR